MNDIDRKYFELLDDILLTIDWHHAFEILFDYKPNKKERDKIAKQIDELKELDDGRHVNTTNSMQHVFETWAALKRGKLMPDKLADEYEQLIATVQESYPQARV